ncbi:MAG TPA: hypothetical protein VIM11_19655 [Tepidisphaeraceae bacterium]|jgi:hypothetical protein
MNRIGSMARWMVAATLVFGTQLFAEDKPAGIPANYILAYASDFSKPDAINQFRYPDPKAWRISQDKDGATLELFGEGEYRNKIRSPFNFALLSDRVFTDVIIDAEACSTVQPYGHQDMCLIYGFKTPNEFYYTHIAVAPDPHAHNCFIVNNADRLAIGKEVSKGVTWGVDQWHKIRIVRMGSDGTTLVFFDDMSKPIMKASDKTFTKGYIGFGSFDDKGKYRNIRVYAPSVDEKKTDAFKPAAK